MPTYRYECPLCGEFEVDHGMLEVLTLCPLCELPDPKKLIATSFAFKCHRLGSEVCPAHAAWLDSDETRARLRLPETDPRSLRVVAKNEDLRHGAGSQRGVGPRETVSEKERRIEGHLEKWKAAGSPGIAKVAEMAAAGKLK